MFFDRWSSVRNHGMDEVRARVKADTQKAAAREAAARLLKDTPQAVLPNQPATEVGSTPTTAIRPSFEMYSPDTDEADIDGKFDVDEEDEDDDDDDDESIDEDDTPPNTNFDLPPPLMVSPLKANPLGGGAPEFGTPPFLERRLAWGGSGLMNLSMKCSVELQQVRPGRKVSTPPPGTKLPPPSSFPVPSTNPSRPPPPPPTLPPLAPPAPYQEAPNHTHPTPDFSSDPAESYADPTIMQAIIASMSPPSMDFNFGNMHWTDGMSLLAGVNGSVDMGSWHASDLDSSFPRASLIHSTSSSTLHSALG